MSNNRLNRPSNFRGRMSDLNKENKRRKRISKKAFETQRRKVLSYLKDSNPNESMNEFVKRMKKK